MLAFVTFGREAEQDRCAAVARSGKAVASEGTVALFSRLLLLRGAFLRARFLVRLDAGFATLEVFDFLDACPRLDYVVSILKNAVLVRHAEPAVTRARPRSARSGGTIADRRASHGPSRRVGRIEGDQNGRPGGARLPSGIRAGQNRQQAEGSVMEDKVGLAWADWCFLYRPFPLFGEDDLLDLVAFRTPRFYG